jgi:hypothetical protein
MPEAAGLLGSNAIDVLLKIKCRRANAPNGAEKETQGWHTTPSTPTGASISQSCGCGNVNAYAPSGNNRKACIDPGG